MVKFNHATWCRIFSAPESDQRANSLCYIDPVFLPRLFLFPHSVICISTWSVGESEQLSASNVYNVISVALRGHVVRDPATTDRSSVQVHR